MSKSNEVRQEAILAALARVQDPDLHKDLVTLNMIRDLEISGEEVSFTVVLTTPACPLKSKIENDARQAVLSVEGVRSVKVKMDASVPSDGRARGLLELPIRNAIAVASGKGGVGKSTVAANVAVVLAQSGAKVGLLDADIYGPNIPTMMGVNRLPAPVNNRLLPAEAHGVKIMSIGLLVKPDQPLIWRGPMLHSAIRQFLTDVDWGELDYLLVDLPPGTGDAALSLAQSLPLSGGVIVTLPQQVSLDDARRGLEMFRQLEVPIFGVVENMSSDVFGVGGGQRLAEAAGVPFIGSIPLDPTVREGGDSGLPVVVSFPGSKVAQALSVIAKDIAAKISISAMQQTNFVPINLIG